MTNASRLATVALLVSALVACRKSPAESGSIEAATIKKRDPARVRVEPVVCREMLRILETTTRVESEHQVEVTPRSAGIVTEVFVEEGGIVTLGQILARMDPRELAIAVSDAEVALEEARSAEPRLDLSRREAEAKLATAKRSYDQIQRDFDRNVAISQASPDRPALLSPKDLDASRLARDNALAETNNAALAVERGRLEQDNAKTAARRAQLTLDRARLNLENVNISAPFAGVLAARNIKVGDTINVATSAFTLTDPAHLRVVFYRPQRELGMFMSKLANSDAPSAQPGESPRSAEVELFASAEALPGKRFKGAILRIAPTIDPQSGNFRVTASLNGTAEGERGLGLLPGMLVRLEIITERRAAVLVVPKRALRREGDLNMVFVVRDNKAVRVVVSEGLADGETLEVTPLAGAQLKPGESVVVVGNRDLEDGGEVSVADDGEIADVPKPSAIAEATARSDGHAAPTNEIETRAVDPAAEAVAGEGAGKPTAAPAESNAPAQPASGGGQ